MLVTTDAKASEIAEAVTVKFNQALPHRKAVWKASCKFSPVSQLTKHFTSSTTYLLFSQTLKTTDCILRGLHRSFRSSYRKTLEVAAQLSLVKLCHSLVFYTPSPITKDTFCPCLAFTRSCSATCLRHSLLTQSYTAYQYITQKDIPSTSQCSFDICFEGSTS